MKGISSGNGRFLPRNISRTISFLSIGLFLVTSTSCSWISSRRTLFGEDGKKVNPSKVKSVPKAQYDALLRKYEAATQKQKIAKANSEMDAFEKNSKNNPNIVDALSNAKVNSTELAETVDVFGKKGIVSGAAASSPMSFGKSDMSTEAVERQIKKLNKGRAYLAQNKFDSALTNLRQIENSPNRQIRVRAKFYIGEIMFRQQEYDLAMQIYEELITHDAFSGVVLKTLGRLIVCAEKLKINKKKEKYYSILHDFFEAS